jgi:class 3 adenylate cyclase
LYALKASLLTSSLAVIYWEASEVSDAKTAIIRYVFLDVVDFSLNRTVEAQSAIVQALNDIVKGAIGERALPSNSVIFLPTGDGICICLINLIDPYDIHMQIALDILKRLEEYNHSQADVRRKFKVRIGINENQDNLIIDINNQNNVAGLGINTAQRIMAVADPLQINVGVSVFERLSQRELYSQQFRKRNEEVKHGTQLVCYQYVNASVSYLDSRLPGKPHKDERIPQQVAAYYVLLSLLRAEIEKHYSSGSSAYSLVVLLSFITMDCMQFMKCEDLEKRTWESMIFDDEIDSFAKAYQKIQSSYFWLICDSNKYYRSLLLLDIWAHIFKKGHLSGNSNYAKMVAKQWPGLQRHIVSLLNEMYHWPNLQAKQ